MSSPRLINERRAVLCRNALIMLPPPFGGSLYLGGRVRPLQKSCPANFGEELAE